jgi:hypothetical protein
MDNSENSEDFWEDVYEHPMADFLWQYEQWACTQNQSKYSSLYIYFNLMQHYVDLNERDSLGAIQKQVCKMILQGLGE